MIILINLHITTALDGNSVKNCVNGVTNQKKSHFYTNWGFIFSKRQLWIHLFLNSIIIIIIMSGTWKDRYIIKFPFHQIIIIKFPHFHIDSPVIMTPVNNETGPTDVPRPSWRGRPGPTYKNIQLTLHKAHNPHPPLAIALL